MLAEIEELLTPRPAVVLIAGPTASGKSQFAMGIAERIGGVVVNADSMQVYRDLRILTARPDPEDERRIPHRLYGHVPSSERYSVGRWLAGVEPELKRVRDEGLVAILVGGTGLYFKALTEGLAAIPPIPEAVRQRVQEDAEGEDAAALHTRLAILDPETAAAVRPSDRSRIVRALEVFAATGRPLVEWQKGKGSSPLVRSDAVRLVLAPDRAVLHERIAVRAQAMLAGGAVDEVRDLLALGLSPDLPAMKAIGVHQIAGLIAGEVSDDEALMRIKTETRRYAKRQETWFRNQMADWRRVGIDDTFSL